MAQLLGHYCDTQVLSCTIKQNGKADEAGECKEGKVGEGGECKGKGERECHCVGNSRGNKKTEEDK